jgi:hypothetical protein
MKISDFGQSASTSEELTDRSSDNLNGTTGANASNFPVYLKHTGPEMIVKGVTLFRHACSFFK